MTPGNSTVASSVPPPGRVSAQGDWLWGILLAIIIAVVYAPVASFEFVNWDDDQYIVENPRVLGGLTLENIGWAFTTTHVANWHPLTWLSHQLDCTLWGSRPGPAHVENVLWHMLNSWLVIRVLRRLGASTWFAVVVAAIFALHPLRVESVAWISERKDLLSATTSLLAVLAHLNYVASPSWRRMATVVGWQVASLMFKPMLVTLPVLLLILDGGPLARLTSASWRQRLLEKLPLVLVSALFCAIAIVAQHAGGALRPLDDLPLIDRITNASAVTFVYLQQTVWPTQLACFYPLKVYGLGGASLLMFAVISVLSLWPSALRRQLSYGWLWYIVALLPVIGLVQVGGQSHADRYTYLPQIGLLVMLVGSTVRWLPNRRIQAVIATAVVGVLAWQSSRQVLVWRDSEKLFTHCLAVTGEQPLPHFNLGLHLANAGRTTEAEQHYRRAIELQPRYPKAHNNLGVLLKQRGELLSAAEHFRIAIEQQNGYFEALMNLGQSRDALGEPTLAIDCFRQAVDAEPSNHRGHTALGRALLNQGNLTAAATRLGRALELQPHDPEAMLYLGIVKLRQGSRDEGRQLLKKAHQAAAENRLLQQIAADELSKSE